MGAARPATGRPPTEEAIMPNEAITRRRTAPGAGLAPALGLALGLALALAGCGAHANHGKVATAGGPASHASSAASDGLTDQQRALKFAACMRANGLPDFPDPQLQGGGIGISAPQGADAAKVNAATQKCKQYLPNGGEPTKLDPQRLEKLRKLAKCMREHGITDFPDPTDQGIQINGNTAHLNPDDPKFKAADEACAQFRPAAPSGSTGRQVGTAG
jgi:hypothetical protein